MDEQRFKIEIPKKLLSKRHAIDSPGDKIQKKMVPMLKLQKCQSKTEDSEEIQDQTMETQEIIAPEVQVPKSSGPFFRQPIVETARTVYDTDAQAAKVQRHQSTRDRLKENTWASNLVRKNGDAKHLHMLRSSKKNPV